MYSTKCSIYIKYIKTIYEVQSILFSDFSNYFDRIPIV